MERMPTFIWLPSSKLSDFLKKIKTPTHRHYPLILRRDVIRLERQAIKIADYWFKFPCFSRVVQNLVLRQKIAAHGFLVNTGFRY